MAERRPLGEGGAAPLGADVGMLDQERDDASGASGASGRRPTTRPARRRGRVRLPWTTGPKVPRAPSAVAVSSSSSSRRAYVASPPPCASSGRTAAAPTGVPARELAIVDADQLEVAAVGQPHDAVEVPGPHVARRRRRRGRAADSSSAAAASGSAQAMTRWSMPRIMRTMLPASGRLTGPMTHATDRPAPGSHDRSVPSGSLEESAANLFDAMLAAREAEERGERRAARTPSTARS